jgi:carbonic anhydrase
LIFDKYRLFPSEALTHPRNFKSVTVMLPEDLHNGYRRFRQDRFRTEAARYRDLAAGQAPETMIIACADSRVDPATIFAAAPGELFVVRNVAALVPPCDPATGYHGTSAALEFAVTGLGVRNIVVLGHGLCGGVAASLEAANQRSPGQFIGPWVELLSPVRDRVLADPVAATAEDRQRMLERMGVLFSMSNLRTFPFVADAVADGSLSLHGAWFSIAEGELYWYGEDTGTFAAVET